MSLGIAAAVVLGAFGAGYAVGHSRSDDLTRLPAAFAQGHDNSYGFPRRRSAGDDMHQRPDHWDQR
jgi:hypothetical protein